MQTLKKITLDIEVDDVDVDPLFGIPSDFEEMRNKNIIEAIDILVLIPTGGRGGDDWRRLDEVLTGPGWVWLEEVRLIIAINTYGRTNGDNELEVALKKLPETQFPRLSSSKTIIFKFDCSSDSSRPPGAW